MDNMTRETILISFQAWKPLLAVIFLQAGLAGMDIISKAALNEGMSCYVFVVYRHAIATVLIAPFAITLEKKIRPPMTAMIFLKIVTLSVLEPILGQILYFLGMKYTTATFAAAMCNMLPAITFIIACLARMENIRIRSIRSQAKIFGTLATVAGAMIMTLVTGPDLGLPWTRPVTIDHSQTTQATSLAHTIKGAVMISLGCLSWACFMILQAVTLKTYPAELSLTAWICFLATAEGAAVALVAERGKPLAWAIKWDTKLLAAVYAGVFCSGIAYYVQGIVMRERGPVYVTAFNPLNMIIVAILSSFILAEQMFLGRVIGAIVIIVGLYLVIWGKKKDESPKKAEKEPVNQITENVNQ